MKFIYRILCVPFVNLLLRGLVKLVRPALPGSMLNFVPVVGKVEVELPGGKPLILQSDGLDWIATLIAWNGLSGFEPDTVNVYLHLLKNARRVFDIGANIGLYALLAAVQRPDCDVHAFEPLPVAYDRMLKNIELNGVRNLKPVRAAVSNFDGEIPLYVPDKIVVPRSASTLEGFRKAKQTLVVPALKLDSYIASNAVGPVDLIKLDTERTEPLVLEGGRQLLERDQSAIICEVLDGENDAALQAFFANTPYQFYLITDQGLVRKDRIVSDPARRFANYLFVPQGKAAALLQGLPLH
jgi:FkbM family methyltransferase